MNDAKKVLKDNPYILAFLIPLVIFITNLALVGNYPFGESSYAIWDMKLQYLDYFSWLKRVLNGEANLFYSFGMSLGSNTIGLFAYYLSSPFNLLLFFFEDIQLYIVVVTTLKIACCGLTCSYFLKKRFNEMDSIWNILLASSYALMAYNLDQSSNIMWLDGVVFLPLMMLGVYQMAKNDKKGLLYISVVLTIISNWYVAYMCCLFSAFYYIYEKTIDEKFNLKNIGKGFIVPFLKYCGVMLLGVGSTMVFFLPTIVNLLQGKGMANMVGEGFRCTLQELITGLIPGQVQVINTSVLIMYCGSFTVIGILFYFATQEIKVKQKIISGCLLFFLIFSAIWVPLENIWNGFRKVASYYCRFTFIICFFMVYLAAVYLALRKISRKHVEFAIVCVLVVIGELGYNTYTVMDKMNSENAITYNTYVEDAKAQMEYLEEYDTSQFYRVEQTTSRGIREGNYLGTYNEGIAYGFSPLSSYTSTYDSNIVKLSMKCGYSECDRITMYHEPMLVSDSLLGIKYVMSNRALYGFEKIVDSPTYNKKTLYENPYALNLGYVVNESAFEEIEASNSFEYQNQLLSKLIGENIQVYKPVSAELTQKDGEWIWTMNSPKCKNVMYGYLTRRGANSVDIYIDGQHRTYYSQWTSYKTFQIADSSNGEQHTVSMRGNIVNTDGIQGVFYYLDIAEFEKAISKLQKTEFEPLVFEDGYVEGTYTASQTGNLMLTVPYDKGWTVVCNDKTVEPEIVQDVFMVIPVEEGENHIVMKYATPGIQTGTIITFGSIVIFILWQFVVRRKSLLENACIKE